MNIMKHPRVYKRQTSVKFQCWCWGLAMLLPLFSGGCARVTPVSEPTPADLQVTADALKAAVREAQRNAAELRTELDAQRRELADAQVARAQLQGMLQETERRLADARQIIDLQREELAEARSERERLAQAVPPAPHRPRQSTKGPARGKGLPSVSEGPAQTLLGKGVSVEQPAPIEQVAVSDPTGPREPEMVSEVVAPPVVQSSAVFTSSGDGEMKTIVIRSGDTLSALARRHKVGVTALRTLNGLSGDRILTGRTLRLPEPRLQQAAIPPPSGTVVQ
ncbi:MAG: LysM peptidoglycan-binding domain-containing protein [Nitrospira sp.]|nr:LysM peptidoglycan-binding domain-containing protein [Nitrospira sp.]